MESVTRPSSGPASGERIVYEWYGKRSAKDIFVWDGSTSRALATDVETTTSHVHPAWSPDGRRIAFESLDDASSRDSIWVVGADGSSPKQLVGCQTAGCVQYAFPSWSRSGKQLAVLRFDALPNGDWTVSAVEVVDLATGARRVVAELPTGQRTFSEAPSWSPDDSRLVVQIDSFDASGNPTGEGLTVLAADGGPQQKLTVITPPAAWASYPDWHPTKDLIVFNDHDLGLFQSMAQGSAIWVVRPDGGGLRRISRGGPAKLAQPSYSPDGKRILLAVATGTGQVSSVELATMTASGARLTMLGIQGAHARFDPSG